MADEQIVTNIVATSNFSGLITDVQRTTAALSKLQMQLSLSNKNLAMQAGQIHKAFGDTLRSTDQFTSHFTTVSSGIETFGKNLDSGKLKLKDYFKDSWRELRKTEGFTENTDVNTMRWNLKFQEKKVRYDGILYRGNGIMPIFTKLVGTKPIQLNKKMTDEFIKNFITNEHDKVKYNKKKTINIFPSDHFAVISKFILKH